MRARKLTDEEFDRINNEEMGFQNNYYNYAKEIMQESQVNRYNMLDNLCLKVETEQAEWLDYEDGTALSRRWWYYEDNTPYDFDFDKFEYFFTSGDHTIIKYYYVVEKMLKDKSSDIRITRAEWVIALLYGSLRTELRKTEEWLKLHGVCNTTLQSVHNQVSKRDNSDTYDFKLNSFVIKYNLKNDNEDDDQDDLYTKRRISQYNKYARKILNNFFGEERIASLKKLINMIETDYVYIWDFKHEYNSPVSSITVGDIIKINECFDDIDYQEYLDMFGNSISRKKIAEHINTYNLKATVSELELMFLHDSLNKEIENCKEELLLFKNNSYDSSKSSNTTTSHEPIPHFNMQNSEAMVQHWVEVYSCLVKKGWLRSNETESGDWVYICCGHGISPINPIQWHGRNSALAYIIRRYFEGNWDVAHSVFRLKGNKELPPSFKTTKSPVKKVCDTIDSIFKKH